LRLHLDKGELQQLEPNMIWMDFQPGSTQNMYGLVMAGARRSTDFGQTCMSISDSLKTAGYLYDLAVDGTSTSVIYAFLTNYRCKSTDAGMIWSSVLYSKRYNYSVTGCIDPPTVA
jgi:hypothetical protein